MPGYVFNPDVIYSGVVRFHQAYKVVLFHLDIAPLQSIIVPCIGSKQLFTPHDRFDPVRGLDMHSAGLEQHLKYLSLPDNDHPYIRSRRTCSSSSSSRSSTMRPSNASCEWKKGVSDDSNVALCSWAPAFQSTRFLVQRSCMRLRPATAASYSMVKGYPS